MNFKSRYNAARLLILICIVAFVIGITYALFQGNYAVAISIIIFTYLCIYFTGNKIPTLYLKKALLNRIKNNGGQLPYESAKTFFSGSYRKSDSEKEIEAMFSEILNGLVEENVVHIENGLIVLK